MPCAGLIAFEFVGGAVVADHAVDRGCRAVACVTDWHDQGICCCAEVENAACVKLCCRDGWVDYKGATKKAHCV